MKIEMQHVCRDINSYGGTEAWTWLRKLVLVYETDTREKIQFGEKKNSVKREKIR